MLKNAFPLCLLALLLSSPLLATDDDSPESNVLGEPCPELFLEEEMVQGVPLTQEDFERKVVLFVFYQRDCNGCERLAMPRLQKLYEKYEHKHCVLVVAINTAFDKDDYPVLADIEDTRKHLKRMKWTMPVLRDLNEESNALFELDEVAGTPQAVLLDVDGSVQAHDWFSAEKEMDRVQGKLESLVARLNCDCVPMPREVSEPCKRARQAIKDGDYANAYDMAKTICDSYGYTDQDKKDAEYLRDFVNDIANDRMERARKNFDYDPVRAVEDADDVMQDFRDVEGVDDFAIELEKWRASDHLKDYERLDDEVAEIEKKMGEAGKVVKPEDQAKVQGELRAILKKAGDTAIADRVKGHLKGLGADVEAADKIRGKSAGEATHVKSKGATKGVDRGSAKSAISPEASKPASKVGSKPASTAGRISSHRSHR